MAHTLFWDIAANLQPSKRQHWVRVIYLKYPSSKTDFCYKTNCLKEIILVTQAKGPCVCAANMHQINAFLKMSYA